MPTPPLLETLAFRFGPAEYAALMLLILTIVVALAPGSLLKASAMAILGLLLGTLWGVDVNSGVERSLLGLHFGEHTDLATAALVFGFLLPAIGRYAKQPGERQAQRTGPLLYNGFFLYESLPALLAMRQSWLPPRWVVPLVSAWAGLLGAYLGLAVHNLADAVLCAGFLAAGVLFQQLGAVWPPLLVGLLLSAPAEENLRRAFLLSKGEWSNVATRPIAASLLTAALVLMAVSWAVRARRR